MEELKEAQKNKIIGTLSGEGNFNSHHHHLSLMELGHLLTRSGLTCPEASSKVCHDSFCRSGSGKSYRRKLDRFSLKL
jgi:hypothetical protein